jgi:hypothetical protein
MFGGFMGVSYGFSVSTGGKREKGYILVPGLRTSRVAPIVNIGMSAPDWIKYLVSCGYHEKADFRDPLQLNDLIYHRSRGLFFQGLKWRIQDPSDAAGYGIGINTLNRMDIIGTINPEEAIKELSQKLATPIKRGMLQLFFQIFTPSAVAKLSAEDIVKALSQATALPEPKKTFELISISIDVIKESVKNKTIPDQNQIAGTIEQFIKIVELMGVKSDRISSRSLTSLLCMHKPGEIPPNLLPLDIAVIFHEFVLNAEAGGLPIVMSFIVSDILRAYKTASPEEILWEANHRLPSDERIEQHVRKLYRRIASLISSKGFSTQLSEDKFSSICSPSEVRKEAIWWEYNLTLGKLEELMRDFVGPYRFQTPWSGKLRKEFIRLSSDQTWNRKAKVILQRTAELANNVASKETYAFAIDEETLVVWFREIQRILNSTNSIDSRFRRLWEFSDHLSRMDEDPVANYDSSTDMILLHKDPREVNPYIQRPIVYAWVEKFGRIWRDII